MQSTVTARANANMVDVSPEEKVLMLKRVPASCTENLQDNLQPWQIHIVKNLHSRKLLPL